MRSLLGILLAVAVVAYGGPVASAAVAPDRLDTARIDSYVDDYLDRHGLVGAGIAVVHDGEVVHAVGRGEDGDAPATAATPFSTGSVGKAVTAVAVLQLVDDGVVGLDDPVVRHVPGFELADGRQGEVTVRQLLSHTSGIPSPVITPPAHDLAEGVAALRDLELASDPGRVYSYSNANFHLSARLVEEVAGAPFGEHLDDEVFAPLGMSDTVAVDTTHADHPGTQHGHVTAWGTALPGPALDQLVAGAGGVVTTAEDMARFAAMLTDGGRTPDGGQLVSADLLAQAHTPQLAAERYGLGWQLSSAGTEPARGGHAGSTTRYSAQLHVVPESGYGVVVMLNSFTPTYEHPYELSSGIIDLTEGDDATPGAPVATLIDWALGLATLVVLGVTALGLRRAGAWATRRAGWSGWTYALRLAPQAVFPALAVVLVGVVPVLQNNSSTPYDVLTFWPAAALLVLALAVSGVALIGARTWRRLGR